jgi:hypothetical protein
VARPSTVSGRASVPVATHLAGALAPVLVEPQTGLRVATAAPGPAVPEGAGGLREDDPVPRRSGSARVQMYAWVWTHRANPKMPVAGPHPRRGRPRLPGGCNS